MLGGRSISACWVYLLSPIRVHVRNPNFCTDILGPKRYAGCLDNTGLCAWCSHKYPIRLHWHERYYLIDKKQEISHYNYNLKSHPNSTTLLLIVAVYANVRTTINCLQTPGFKGGKIWVKMLIRLEYSMTFVQMTTLTYCTHFVHLFSLLFLLLFFFHFS